MSDPTRTLPGTETNEVASVEAAGEGVAARKRSLLRGLTAVKRETRVGVAAMVSFLILVTVLFVNHSRKKAKDDEKADDKQKVAASDKATAVKKPAPVIAKTEEPKSQKPEQHESKPAPDPRLARAAARKSPANTALAMQIGGGKANTSSPAAAPEAPSPPVVPDPADTASELPQPLPVDNRTKSGEHATPPTPIPNDGFEEIVTESDPVPPLPADVPSPKGEPAEAESEHRANAQLAESPPPAPLSPGPVAPDLPSGVGASPLALKTGKAGATGASPRADSETLEVTTPETPDMRPSGNEAPEESTPTDSSPNAPLSAPENLESVGAAPVGQAEMSALPTPADRGAALQPEASAPDLNVGETSRPATEEAQPLPAKANAGDAAPVASTTIPELSSPPPSDSLEPASAAVPSDGSGFVTLPNSKKPLGPAQPLADRDTPAVIPPGPAAPPENVDAPIEPIIHVVQRGENFWTISQLYYTTGRFYKALWKANEDQVKSPEDLYVGMAIRVPPPEKLDGSLFEPVKRPRAASAPSPTTAVRPRPNTPRTSKAVTPGSIVMLPVRKPRSRRRPVEERETRPARRYYVVKQHETLRSIARDQLRDSHRDEEIRDLNLHVLGESVDLTAGMTLELPDDAGTVRR